MDSVRRLIAAVACNPAHLSQLQHDPYSLVRGLALSAASIGALRGVDRFFQTEKPILDQPRAQPVAPRAGQAQVIVVPPPPPTPVTVTADTGTLRPGPIAGTYTVTSSATATTTG